MVTTAGTWSTYDQYSTPTLPSSRTAGATQHPPEPVVYEIEIPLAEIVDAIRPKFQEMLATLPSATPDVIELAALPHPRLRLRAPLRLEVLREDDTIGVWHEELEEIGYGPYLTAAIEDFQQTLIETYFTLRDDQDRLGPGMVGLWESIKKYVEERA